MKVSEHGEVEGMQGRDVADDGLIRNVSLVGTSNETDEEAHGSEEVRVSDDSVPPEVVLARDGTSVRETGDGRACQHRCY